MSFVFGIGGDRDLPLGICFYFDASESYYGDRVCNNGLAGAIASILVVIPLMLMDLLLPFSNSTVCAYIFLQATFPTCNSLLVQYLLFHYDLNSVP